MAAAAAISAWVFLRLSAIPGKEGGWPVETSETKPWLLHKALKNARGDIERNSNTVPSWQQALMNRSWDHCAHSFSDLLEREVWSSWEVRRVRLW